MDIFYALFDPTRRKILELLTCCALGIIPPVLPKDTVDKIRRTVNLSVEISSTTVSAGKTPADPVFKPFPYDQTLVVTHEIEPPVLYPRLIADFPYQM